MLAAFADLGVTDYLADLTVTSLEKYVVRLFCESDNLNNLRDARWSIVHKTAGLRQFTTNEDSLKVQGFTKPPHMSYMEIVSFAISKIL